MAQLQPVIGTAQVQPASIEQLEKSDEKVTSGLASYIRQQFQNFKNHRDSEGISNRIRDCLLQYNGEYKPEKLADIKAFGGSEVFARLTTVKCRGASAMLRDVFLGNEKTWAVEPTPVPTLPDNITASIDQLVQMEMMGAAQAGQPIPPEQILDRRNQLFDAAQNAAIRNAKEQAKRADRYIYDILVEGGFYKAMKEFLVDLPIFPFACIKGPVVRMTTQLKWVDGNITEQQIPKMFWQRTAPENLYFSPGMHDIGRASIIEKIKISRAELNSLLDLKGYFKDEIEAVLEEYEHGLVDWIDQIDTEMAEEQGRENPVTNTSELIDTLEFHGAVKGSYLRELGFEKKQVPDEKRDYHVVAWLIGTHIIKVQINPNPRARKPYYVTAFETVPGSIYGHGVPEIITDAQDVANACLRSLVNNMSISSGPQVAINEDRLSPSTDANSLYPWKRWRFTSDPFGSNSQPIDFFQPTSNAAELLAVYKEMQTVADETSAIPRYITGSEKVGGAASTASGLSMLMNNASKVLQNVAASIDNDIMQPMLQDLYEMIMLTDQSDLFRGDESIVVRGVTIAMQRETDRVRRLEFLQLTGNPIDMGIVGADGRAKVLRSIAQDLGLDGEDIVPNEQELLQRMQAALQQQAATGGQGQEPMSQKPRPREASKIMQPEAPV